MVRAFEQGADTAEPWVDPRTYASGLRVPAAVGDRLILEALRESHGIAVAVTDREMAAGQLELARGEGIFPQDAGVRVRRREDFPGVEHVDADVHVVRDSDRQGPGMTPRAAARRET